MRVAFEAVMLWVAFPSLLLPASVSVTAAAAAGAIEQRTVPIEVPVGIDYQFPIWFAFVVFASMAINLFIALTLWPTAPARGMPWIAGIFQLALIGVLAGWTAHFVWEGLYVGTPVATAVGQSPLERLAALAPLLCIGLSVGSLTGVLLRRRASTAVGTPTFTLSQAARGALIAYLGVVVAALVIRFVPPLDSTFQNAMNWVLVILGAPISILAAPITWIVGQIAVPRLDEGSASIIAAVLFTVPVLLNVACVILALRSQSFRERWVPAIALD